MEGDGMARMFRLWLLLLAFLSSLRCTGSAPLAVKLPASFDNDEIAQLRLLEDKVKLSRDDELVEFRKFGKDSIGHEMTFLHKHLDFAAPRLRRVMLELAKAADVMGDWNLTKSVNMSARCMEVIRYTGNRQADIGWHTDGGSLLTVATMLSARDEYEGGQSEFMDGDAFEDFVLDKGDALVWRGWIEHRVRQVVSGQRDVFVVEWWMGQDCADSGHPRSEDDSATLEHIARVESENECNGKANNVCTSKHHRRLGKSLCMRLPCEGDDVARAAERAYEAALMLSEDVFNLAAYGSFLGSSGNSTIKKRGIDLLHRAVSLDPSHEGLRRALDAALEQQSANGAFAVVFALAAASLTYFIVYSCGS